MSLFNRTEQDYFLNQIGRKLVEMDTYGPHEVLENQEEREIYLKAKAPQISLPILEGYSEKAEEEAFRTERDRAYYKRGQFAKESVRALSLMREICKEEGGLLDKINKRIISIGDKANMCRPEYVFGDNYGIDEIAFIFAYNSADKTLGRRLETTEKMIEGFFRGSSLDDNFRDLCSNIPGGYARRITNKLNKQFEEHYEQFDRPYNSDKTRILGFSKVLLENANFSDVIEKSLNRELLARIKYPNSKMINLNGDVLIITGKKVIELGKSEKELLVKAI